VRSGEFVLVSKNLNSHHRRVKIEKIVILLALCLCMYGCATPASSINAVHIGMSKTEVIAVMGKPSSVTADGTAEYLNYSLAENGVDGAYFTQSKTPYEVKLVNGKVVSYGRAGKPRGAAGF
jgi:hypothetical protein